MERNSKRYVIIGIVAAVILIVIICSCFGRNLLTNGEKDEININPFGGSLTYESAKPYKEITPEDYEREFGDSGGLERNFNLPEDMKVIGHLYNLTADEKGEFTVLRNEEYTLESDTGEVLELRFSKEGIHWEKDVVNTSGEKLSQINGAIADIKGDEEKGIFSASIQEHNGFYFYLYAYNISKDKFVDIVKTITAA